jgi:hypothetical protein
MLLPFLGCCFNHVTQRMIEKAAADNENMLSGRRPKQSTRQKALAQQMERKEGMLFATSFSFRLRLLFNHQLLERFEARDTENELKCERFFLCFVARFDKLLQGRTVAGDERFDARIEQILKFVEDRHVRQLILVGVFEFIAVVLCELFEIVADARIVEQKL